MKTKYTPNPNRTNRGRNLVYPPNKDTKIEPKQIIAVKIAFFLFIYRHKYMKRGKAYLSFSSFLRGELD